MIKNLNFGTALEAAKEGWELTAIVRGEHSTCGIAPYICYFKKKIE